MTRTARAGTILVCSFLVLPVLILVVSWTQPANTVAQEQPQAKEYPSLRIEVYCDFPVRPLLGQPDQIPRLWKRFENSILQTFPADPVSVDELWAASNRRAREQERIIASHAGLLARGDRRDVRLADGYYTPALRTLADRIGEPRRRRIVRGTREWIRNQLPLNSTHDEVSGTTSTALLRHGGYRLLTSEYEGGVYRPATRTLMLAGAELERTTADSGADGALTVFVGLPGGPGTGTGGHWEEFTATLDLLALEHSEHMFDVWLWGKGAGGTAETVRFVWGPEVARGMVQHESQFARLYHRWLRDVPFKGAVEEPESGEDNPSGNSEPGQGK